MNEIEQLLNTVGGYAGYKGAELVSRAAHFAEESHRGFSRLDGSPYIAHPVKVASILAEWHAPPEVIAAGLLHDVPKPKYSNRPSLVAIEENFPSSIVSMVREVARLGRFGPGLRKSPMEATTEITRGTENETRLSWTTAVLQRNPMAIVIKIADRLHNLETLEALPRERQERFTTAVLNIFAPFAARLGMDAAKRQLQDGSLRILDPEEYTNADAVYQDALLNPQVGDLISGLQQALDDSNVPARTLCHLTHRYGIYRRWLESGKRAPTAAEVLSLIVLTNSVEDCYRALGVVHGKYRPLNEFHDYIATPKPNGYRALQTHVSQQSLGVFRVSLRTEEMHLVAEYGITAGWHGVSEKLLPKITPLPKPPEGHIMVLTPKGDIKYLPKGATPVDFAYSIHTEVGHRCLTALVNGARAPLDSRLEDGDIIEIIVGRGITGPNPEWLSFVVTDVAKQAISKWSRRKKEVEIAVEAWDRVGLVQDVSTAISGKGLNMTYFHADALVDGKASIRIGLGQINEEELDQLHRELRAISHVFSVQTEAPQAPPRAHPRSIASYRVRGNPYTIAHAVFGNYFKGREPEIENIVHRLRGQDQNNALLIWGQKRIGKTSLLVQLERYILPSKGYLPVFVSMLDIPKQPIGIFLHRIAFAIEQKLHDETVHAPTVNKIQRKPIYYFRRFIDQIERVVRAHTLLIILDEFQGIGELKEEGATKQDVFSCFRSLIQHGVAVNFLFSGGGLPKRLISRSGISSLLSVVDLVRLDCLNTEAATAVITELAPSLEYTDQAVERLLEVTHCHPCYLQYLCRELFEIADRRTINLSDVEKVIGHTLEWRPRLENLVNHFWTMDLEDDDLAQKNKLVLSAIADGIDSSGWITFDEIAGKTHPLIMDEELTGLLNELLDYGSIDADGLNYRIKIPLFELWLRAMYPFECTLRMLGG